MRQPNKTLVIARNKTENKIADCEFWYIELKKTLSKKEFNHSFRNIRWIVCWDIAKDMKNGTLVSSVVANDEREFVIKPLDGGGRAYFLDDSTGHSLVKIKILPLKEWIESELNVFAIDEKTE